MKYDENRDHAWLEGYRAAAVSMARHAWLELMNHIIGKPMTDEESTLVHVARMSTELEDTKRAIRAWIHRESGEQIALNVDGSELVR